MSPHSDTVPHLQKNAGFTLVEMLIVVTIAALTVALMPGSIDTGRRTLDAARHAEKIDATAEMLHSIAERISQARPVFQVAPSGLSRLVFEGEPDRLSFIADFVDGPAGGGPYRVELSRLPSEPSGEAHLAVSLSPYTAGPTSGLLETRTLPLMRANFAFSYFGRDRETGTDVWQDSWKEFRTLPKLVGLAIRPAGQTARTSQATYPVSIVVPLRLARPDAAPR